MKRFISILLSLLLIMICALPCLAADGPDGQSSRYCPAASMRENRDLFVEMERSGGSAGLTKGMTAGILAALSGEDLSGFSCTLPDVDASAWYASGAVWAVNNGIMLTDGEYFSPDNTVTRENLAWILQKFLNHTGRKLPLINEWCAYNDGGLFSLPAMLDAASLLQKAGVMIEDAEGFFHPDYTVTVLEAEQIFLRLMHQSSEVMPGLPVSTVSESEAVDKSWFDDACFIGHSQVVGMQKYFDLDNADYYAVIGHTAQEVLDFTYYEGPDGRLGTLEQCLEKASYGKVYIMLGINDARNDDDREAKFMEPMRKILDLVKKTQPDATIYLLSLVPVGRYTDNNYRFNPENTLFYSQMIKTLSREYETEYIDIFRILSDEEGYFQDQYNAGDSIHIQSTAYPMIEDYLKRHTA